MPAVPQRPYCKDAALLSLEDQEGRGLLDRPTGANPSSSLREPQGSLAGVGEESKGAWVIVAAFTVR